MKHIPVLLNETIEQLNIKPNGIYVDATLGRAGHSSEILSKLTTGKLYCFDKDNTAIAEGNEKLSAISSNFEIIKSDFMYIKEELESRGVTQVDGILADFGVSSPQLDVVERGFTYRYDAPLDMRMNQDQEFSAYNIVNEYDKQKLSKLISFYGDEKFAQNIASNIVKARDVKPIETTMELNKIIDESIPYKFKRDGHPSKKTFQALRIETNNEIESISKLVSDLPSLLAVDGRFVCISFHSLEDKIVMTLLSKMYKEEMKNVIDNPFLRETPKPTIELVTKKPVKPSNEEVERNPRSKSSLMRVVKKNAKTETASN